MVSIERLVHDSTASAPQHLENSNVLNNKLLLTRIFSFPKNKYNKVRKVNYDTNSLGDESLNHCSEKGTFKSNFSCFFFCLGAPKRK